MLWKIQQRLNYLDHLISLKATGPPKELAKKIHITERAWYKLREELVKDLHFPIAYDAKIRSYVYSCEGKIEMGFRKSST